MAVFNWLSPVRQSFRYVSFWMLLTLVYSFDDIWNISHNTLSAWLRLGFIPCSKVSIIFPWVFCLDLNLCPIDISGSTNLLLEILQYCSFLLCLCVWLFCVLLTMIIILLIYSGCCNLLLICNSNWTRWL